MPNILVEAAGLIKEFQLDGRRIEVLRGVDLALEAGEMVAIVGPSGAGKSTLLHILGLLEAPTGGQLQFEGRDPAGLSHRERARIRLERIGFVFQFHHLLPEFTALENVTMPALIRGEPCRDCRERGVELLTRVGLASRLDHKPGELSGGEQQRVAFARALINKPALILADEPTGNLDLAASEMLRDLLWEVCRSREATLVIVTHNETLVSGAARVLKMVDGRFTNPG
jgi:lipoprotein-releasing system ATP-binding protein